MSAHWYRRYVLFLFLTGPAAVLSFLAEPVRAAEIESPFVAEEIAQYLLIGTKSDDGDDAINVQNGELGADSEFVSKNNPNLYGDFDDGPQGKARWDSTTNTTYDTLPDASPVFEGYDFTGQAAITSKTGGFTYSNTTVYAGDDNTDFAVRCASGAGTAEEACRDNDTSNSDWITSSSAPSAEGSIAAGDGVITNYDHTDLIGELEDLWMYIDDLEAEVTITQSLIDTSYEGVELPGGGDGDGLCDLGETCIDDGAVAYSPGSSYYSSFDLDAADLNDDGVAVIDIVVGDNDWSLNNYDWILNTTDTFAIFRIRGDTNMVMSNSSIAICNELSTGDCDTDPVDSLAAIFVQYQESEGSGDTVISGSNVILNGVGLYDLNAFQDGSYDDSWKTVLNISNGQGCSQFISSTIKQQSSERWNRCAPVLASTDPPVAIPEPATFVLFGIGLAALGFTRRRRLNA